MNDLQKMLTKYQCCKVRVEKKLAEQVVILSLQMIFNTEGSEPEQDEKKAIAENLIQYWESKGVHSGKLTCLNNELERQLFNSKIERSDNAKSPFKPVHIKRIDIINDIYQAVIKEIVEISNPSTQMRFEYVIFFLIAGSGVCFKELADACVYQLKTCKDPLKTVGDFAVMLVRYEKGSHFKNTKHEIEDSRTERIVFLESRTLAAVTAFLNRRKKSLVKMDKATSAFDILQPVFRRVLAGQSSIGMTEHQFYEAVALWLSLKTTGSMPMWLLRYSMGRICSTSMTINSMRLLVERKSTENAERLITVKVESQEKRTKVTEISSKQIKPSSDPLYGAIKDALRDHKSQLYRRPEEARKRLKILLSNQDTTAEEIVVDWIIVNSNRKVIHSSNPKLIHLIVCFFH